LFTSELINFEVNDFRKKVNQNPWARLTAENFTGKPPLKGCREITNALAGATED
jgi:hypothetical protein